MWDEFKKFIGAGNVLDLAVGVIIGGIFNKIVTAFVNDLINPMIGLIGQGVDFTNKYIVLSAGKPIPPNTALEEARKLGSVLAYGDFMSVTLNTLLTAFVVFLFVKAINRFREAEKGRESSAPTAPPADVQLLTEIRDLLAKRSE